MITISVKLFGAFRKYGEQVDVSIKEGSSVVAVKQAMGDLLGAESLPLIGDSVIANDDAVLPADYVFDQDTQLAILPPVCGG